MRVTVVQHESAVEVRVVGSIEVARSHVLRDLIMRVLQDSKFQEDDRGLVVNLAEVDFIDSTGLATLIEARVASKKLVVCEPQDQILGLLTSTGLDRVIPIYKSLEEALQA